MVCICGGCVVCASVRLYMKARWKQNPAKRSDYRSGINVEHETQSTTWNVKYFHWGDNNKKIRTFFSGRFFSLGFFFLSPFFAFGESFWEFRFICFFSHNIRIIEGHILFRVPFDMQNSSRTHERTNERTNQPTIRPSVSHRLSIYEHQSVIVFFLGPTFRQKDILSVCSVRFQ